MKIKGSLTFPTPSVSVAAGQLEKVFVEQVAVLPVFDAVEQGRLVYETNTNTFWYNDATSWVEIVVGGVGAPVSTDNAIVNLGSVGGTITMDLSLGKTFLATITSNVTDIVYTNFDEQTGTRTYEYDIIFTQGGYTGTNALTLPALEYFAIGDSALQLAQGANTRTLMTAKSIGDGTWIYALQPLA